jgi:hypothetical protein
MRWAVDKEYSIVTTQIKSTQIEIWFDLAIARNQNITPAQY